MRTTVTVSDFMRLDCRRKTCHLRPLLLFRQPPCSRLAKQTVAVKSESQRYPTIVSAISTIMSQDDRSNLILEAVVYLDRKWHVQRRQRVSRRAYQCFKSISVLKQLYRFPRLGGGLKVAETVRAEAGLQPGMT